MSSDKEIKEAEVTITVKYDFKGDDIMNLLIGAFEGGSGYWATFSPLGDYPPNKLSDLYGKMVVKNIEEDGKPTYLLTKEKIQKGLELFVEKEPRHFSDFQSGNDDAVTADVFLQMCVLGEVIYG